MVQMVLEYNFKIMPRSLYTFVMIFKENGSILFTRYCEPLSGSSPGLSRARSRLLGKPRGVQPLCLRGHTDYTRTREVRDVPVPPWAPMALPDADPELALTACCARAQGSPQARRPQDA